MAICPPDMKKCHRKKKCLVGPNEGKAYDPQNPCCDVGEFDTYKCDCIIPGPYYGGYFKQQGCPLPTGDSEPVCQITTNLTCDEERGGCPVPHSWGGVPSDMDCIKGFQGIRIWVSWMYPDGSIQEMDLIFGFGRSLRYVEVGWAWSSCFGVASCDEDRPDCNTPVFLPACEGMECASPPPSA